MKKVFVSLLLGIAGILFLAFPALALIAPTSMTVSSVRAFRNIAVAGDMVIVFHYKMQYTSYPSTPASSSVVFRLYDPAGVTLLSSSVPYAFSSFATNGYGDGISAFYFSTALTWNQAYQVNIYGYPAYFSPAQTFTYTMATSEYSSAIDTSDSQADMYNYMIDLCTALKLVYPSVSLTGTTDTGVVFTSYGESYFRGSVPGIQAMCPQLFFSQVYIPETMPVVTYNSTIQDAATNKLLGSDLMTGGDRIGAFFGGVSGYFVFGVLTFVLCIVVCVICMRKDWGIEVGLGISAVVVVCAALLLGSILFTLTMIGALGAAAGIMWILFMKRA